ncbi:MAG TPA: MFS transporter [Chloroflexota bacterium]|nr:MFS transporter [Chloroflexota bacterium]
MARKASLGLRTPAAPPPWGRRVWALVLATLAFTICFAVWGLIAALAPRFRELYDLSATQVGLLVGIPVLLGATARLPLGLLTDRYGGRAVFTALLLALLVPVALVGLTRSYPALLAASFVLGLAGASFAVGVPFVARWFPPERQGIALGIYGMGNIGTAIANLTAPPLAERTGWPLVFWAWLPVLAVAAGAFWLLGHDAPGQTGGHTPLAARLAVFRRQPAAWMLALCYFVTFGAFIAIGGYLPTLLVTTYGLSAAEAGARAAAFVAVAMVARPLGGYLADRWGGAAVLDSVFVSVAVLAAGLAVEPAVNALTAVLLALAAVLGVGNGAVFKLVAQYFPRETGTVTGLVGAAGGLGGFFPPLVMGGVKDVTGSYALSFLLLCAVALTCLVLERRLLQAPATAWAGDEA